MPGIRNGLYLSTDPVAMSGTLPLITTSSPRYHTDENAARCCDISTDLSSHLFFFMSNIAECFEVPFKTRIRFFLISNKNLLYENCEPSDTDSVSLFRTVAASAENLSQNLFDT